MYTNTYINIDKLCKPLLIKPNYKFYYIIHNLYTNITYNEKLLLPNY